MGRLVWPLRLLHVCLLVAFCVHCANGSESMPVAKEGELDLSDWDFEKSGPVELRGEWFLSWERFIEPMPFRSIRFHCPVIAELPSRWSQPADPKLPFLGPQPIGFASYVLKIRLPKGLDSSLLSFSAPSSMSSARWKFYSGLDLQDLGEVSQGIPGETAEESVEVSVDAQMSLVSARDSRDLVLLGHISNFRNALAGIWTPPTLGLHQDILVAKTYRHFISAGVVAILFFFALYHLIVSFQGRGELLSWPFALVCFALALRESSIESLFQKLGIGWARGGYEIFLTIEYLSMSFIAMASGLFLLRIFPHFLFKRFVLGWCIGLGVALVAYALVTDSLTFSGQLWGYLLHLLVAIGGAVAYILLLASKGNPIARRALGPFVVLLCGAVGDGASILGFVSSIPRVAPYTSTLFVLLLSALLSGIAGSEHGEKTAGLSTAGSEASAS